MTASEHREIHAPHGTTLNCQGWEQEAAMRMLMNNLDPAVAEKPDELIVYGGTGKAARNWECFDAIVRELKALKNDETLLVQSGKPVGVFRTHEMAPRVLISNSMLVPQWANWDEFRRLEGLGLTMYGQMTAGSWIYIGTQGILQGTYETFAECARQHFGGSLNGTLTVTAGLGGMGGAQPLAVTMNGGAALIVEADPERIKRRVDNGYCDEWTDDLDDALRRVEAARKEQRPLSVALLGNAAEVLPELIKRDVQVEVVTDQTSAHDALGGYIPAEISLEDAIALRQSAPEIYTERSMASMATHCRSMLEFQRRGSIVFDYGNNLRGQALVAGVQDAFDYPGFVPAFIRPLFCEGKGPFRWAALSGDPEDIYRTDEAIGRLFPENESLQRWIRLARERVPFQGLPTRICWLGYGERDKAGLEFNRMVRDGEISAPIVIGRDHLDTGSVASPYRETEGMRDGSDAIADWPILNALVNTSAGASWISVHHGGGVGIGLSIHAGMVVVADGSQRAEEKLSRVLLSDPGTGVMRHADAGYPEAIDAAKRLGVNVPMLQRDEG